MNTARRPLLVGAPMTAGVALVSSAAVAVAAIGGPSSRPLGMSGTTVPHATVSFLVANNASIEP